MAVENFANKGLLAYPAGADLRTFQYGFVKLNASGQVIKAVAGGGGGHFVLQNAPNTGETAEVAPLDGRQGKLRAGAAVTAGTALTSDATGRADDVVTTGRVNTGDAGAANDPLIGSYHLATAITAAGAADVIFTALYENLGAVPQTVQ